MSLVRNAFVGLSLCVLMPAVAVAADLKEEVTSAYQAWDAAFNKGDAKAVAGFYADDALLLPPTHKVVKGPAEIEEFFAGLFEAGVTDHKLDLIDAGGGETAYGAANWSAQGKAEDGSSQTLGGIATHVFERQDDGSLKLVLHTFN